MAAPTRPAQPGPPKPGTAAPRRRITSATLFLLASALVVVGSWAVQGAVAPPRIVDNPSADNVRLAPSFVDPAEVDRLISAYEERIANHTDALDYRTLGFLYLEEARVSGDVSRYLAAEEAFQRVVELFPSDPSGRLGLASAHYSLHDFGAAAEVAATVYDSTGRLDGLAMVSDAAYASGDYGRAQTALSALIEGAGDNAAVAVREAEAARLEGDAPRALALAQRSVDLVSGSTNPRLLSWYQAFAAQMHHHLGEYHRGRELAEEALTNDPGSQLARLVTARLQASGGDLEGAAATYEDLIEARPDPAYLSELGDVYLLLGDEAAAADTFATLEVVVQLAEAQGIYDRVLTTHLADHGLDTGRAVQLAEADLARRRDVGAYDALAWALYADGRHEEAEEAIASALSMGTLDARYHYHAGLIAAARGDAGRARSHLGTALDVSPEFQPFQADRARRLLAELG